MLTVLTRPASGRLRLEFEWLGSRPGDRPRRLGAEFRASRSVGSIRVALACRLDAKLGRAGEWERHRAIETLNRDLDRAIRAGWI